MDPWIRGFRSCRPVKGEQKVLVPGDPEREMETFRIDNGIPLLEAVTADLNQLAERFSLKELL